MPFRCPKHPQQAIEMKAHFGIFKCINWIFFLQEEVAAAGFSTQTAIDWWVYAMLL